MSDLIRPHVTRTARIEHRCISCGWPIARGEQYAEQTGHWDGKAFRNRFHAECFDDLVESGDGEFTPYSGDPPERLRDGGEAGKG